MVICYKCRRYIVWSTFGDVKRCDVIMWFCLLLAHRFCTLVAVCLTNQLQDIHLVAQPLIISDGIVGLLERVSHLRTSTSNLMLLDE